MRVSLLLVLGLAYVSALYGQDVAGFFTGISNRLAERDYLRVSGRLGVRAGFNAFGSPDGASRRGNPFNYGYTFK